MTDMVPKAIMFNLVQYDHPKLKKNYETEKRD